MRFSLMNGLGFFGCYAVLFIMAGVFLSYTRRLFILYRDRSEPMLRRRRMVVRSIIALFASGFISWFFFFSMFSCFSSVEVTPKDIRLQYFWPRSSRVISVDHLIDTRLEKDRKGRGLLVVMYDQGEVRSISCPTLRDLLPTRAAIDELIKNRDSRK
jgi:hypothetical protein